MRFAQFNNIFWFWLVLAAILFFIWAFKKREKLLKSFAHRQALKQIIPAGREKKYILRYSFIILAIIFSILALMRPQWGYEWLQVKRRGLDILVAIDTSRSMLTSDVKPNRLERSKLAVKDLLKKLKGDRIGLIAFSGDAFLQCPLTVDYSGFNLSLDDMDAGTISKGGTSISSAIKVALRTFQGEGKKYKVLIIITDGEDHEGGVISFARQAKEDNIKIFCIGIGTKAGELIQLTDLTGKKYFLKDKKGNVVKSRLNEELLRKITAITNGSYVRSSGAEFGLDLIYEEKLNKLEKKDIKAQTVKFYHERFQVFLLLAVMFLMVESIVIGRKEK